MHALNWRRPRMWAHVALCYSHYRSIKLQQKEGTGKAPGSQGANSPANTVAPAMLWQLHRSQGACTDSPSWGPGPGPGPSWHYGHPLYSTLCLPYEFIWYLTVTEINLRRANYRLRQNPAAGAVLQMRPNADPIPPYFSRADCSDLIPKNQQG